MTSKLFDIINQRFDFEEVYRQVKDRKRGILYKVIDLMIDSLKDVQLTTKEVCDCFGIKQSFRLENDLEIAFDLIIRNFSLTGLERAAFIKVYGLLEKKMTIKIIVITAFILLSVYIVGMKWGIPRFWQRDKQQKKSSERSSSSISDLPIPSAICLAVPASAASSLITGRQVNRDEIIRLIDAASDFLCVEIEKAENLDVDIDTSQTPSPDSKLKFYTRIDIPDGRDILNGETKYVIKRDLPPNIQGKVKELGRLKSISSISSFNRI